MGAKLFFLFLVCIGLQAKAGVSDLRQLAREVRYGLSSHGRSVPKAERRILRFELASTIVTLQRTTGRKAFAGTTLEGLATASQRLLDQVSDRDLKPAVQRQIEHRLSRCTFVLERHQPR